MEDEVLEEPQGTAAGCAYLWPHPECRAESYPPSEN
jgi:hypothetical protein